MSEKQITVGYFMGSHYWEVKLDDEIVYTTSDRRDAYMFAAELKIKRLGE